MRTIITAAALTAALGIGVLGALSPVSAAIGMQPVSATSITHYVGDEVYGADDEDLGIVSDVDPNRGLVGVWSNDDNFVVLHVSMLEHEGDQLHAPQISIGDFDKYAAERLENPDLVVIKRGTTISHVKAPRIVDRTQT